VNAAIVREELAMKSQILESFFVLGCSVFGLVCGTPVGDLVQDAVRSSAQAIAQPVQFAPHIRVLKLDLHEALTSIW
jgi:hypothetical protein